MSMIKKKGLCLQKCVTYVLTLSLKCVIRTTCKLGDLLSQQFGTACTCALDSLSQLHVLHRLHADMLIGCLAVLVCGLHVRFVFCGQVCVCFVPIFASGTFPLNSFLLKLISI